MVEIKLSVNNFGHVYEILVCDYKPLSGASCYADFYLFTFFTP